MSEFYIPSDNLGIGANSEEYDYELFYNVFNFTGSIVLDAGADYGSTAKFFLEKGCKEVICVESNDTIWPALLENAKRDSRIKPMKLEINTANHWRELIGIKPTPDIFKVDCEYCEKGLLEVEDEIIKTVPRWMIETHSKTLYRAMIKKFVDMKYYIVSGNPKTLLISFSLDYN